MYVDLLHFAYKYFMFFEYCFRATVRAVCAVCTKHAIRKPTNLRLISDNGSIGFFFFQNGHASLPLTSLTTQ